MDEQTKAQHQVPRDKERMLHVLKMKLTKAKSHLAHLQSVEKKKEEEYAHARDLAIEQARYLVEVQNQHDQAFQRVMEGSVVDSATSEGPGLEEISDDEAQLQAMSDDDPDLAPKEWAQPVGFPLGLYLLLEMVGLEVLMLLLVTQLVRVVTRLKESV